MVQIRDRGDANVNVGVVSGTSRQVSNLTGNPLPQGSQVPCYDHDAEVATVDSGAEPLSAKTAATDGPNRVSSNTPAVAPGHYGKAQGPIVARPNDMRSNQTGVTVHLGKGAPVSNHTTYSPNSGKRGVI
jgi:hypothetical protein